MEPGSFVALSACADVLRAHASAIVPQPVALIVFGSTARGTAQACSDVDVLAVRPAWVPFDDDGWTNSLDDWQCATGEIVGRPVELLEAGVDELPGLLARSGPTVWHAIAHEGLVVTGCPLADLAGAHPVG